MKRRRRLIRALSFPDSGSRYHSNWSASDLKGLGHLNQAFPRVGRKSASFTGVRKDTGIRTACLYSRILGA